MQLIIKPHDGSLEGILSTKAYRRMWHEHKRGIIAAFRDVTGLDFQQHSITAHVFLDNNASAGKWRNPMHLPAYPPDDEKLLTLIHELCHRLLGGNSLGPFRLGLVPDEPGDTYYDEFQEYEHRHIYLFEREVVQQALGDTWAEHYRQLMSSGNGPDGPHKRAWEWASALDAGTRQQALQRLCAHAVTRNQWEKLEEHVATAPRDPDAWFAELVEP